MQFVVLTQVTVRTSNHSKCNVLLSRLQFNDSTISGLSLSETFNSPTQDLAQFAI